MPTYDYKCDGCGHTFEEWQSFKDATLTECPKCHEAKLRRLFGGGAAIIFKGSGFYETDYRKDAYKKAADADQKAAGGGEKADAPKADGAAAAKPDAAKPTPAPAAKPAADAGGK